MKITQNFSYDTKNHFLWKVEKSIFEFSIFLKFFQKCFSKNVFQKNCFSKGFLKNF